MTGDVVFVNIQNEKDFDKYKGKLAGKIVLFGAMRDVPPVDKALFERYTDKELEDIAEFPVNANARRNSAGDAGAAAHLHGAPAHDRQDCAVLCR